MNCLSIDTEFTSFYSTDKTKSGELLEIAIVPVIDGVPNRDLAFHEYVRPLTHVWNAHAEKVHKITKKRALTFQHPSECADKLNEWLKKMDNLFEVMGFNCRGDRNYLERFVHDYKISKEWFTRTRSNWIDVYDIAKKRKKQISKKSLKLESLCEFFGYEYDAHKAIEDAVASYVVYEYLQNLKGDKTGIQAPIDTTQTELQKRAKYLELKYVMFNGDGEIFITKHGTGDREALSVILSEIWTLYSKS